MKTTKISNDFHVTGQLELANIPEITAAGFTTVICNRPDNEGWGQINHDVVKTAAEQAGLSFHYIPVGGGLTHEMVHQMKTAITSSKGMVLGYCKSGMRAANLYQAALQHKRLT